MQLLQSLLNFPVIHKNKEYCASLNSEKACLKAQCWEKVTVLWLWWHLDLLLKAHTALHLCRVSSKRRHNRAQIFFLLLEFVSCFDTGSSFTKWWTDIWQTTKWLTKERISIPLKVLWVSLSLDYFVDSKQHFNFWHKIQLWFIIVLFLLFN